MSPAPAPDPPPPRPEYLLSLPGKNRDNAPKPTNLVNPRFLRKYRANGFRKFFGDGCRKTPEMSHRRVLPKMVP